MVLLFLIYHIFSFIYHWFGLLIASGLLKIIASHNKRGAICGTEMRL